jgi:hypothetical protein
MITDSQITALRAALAGDADTLDRLGSGYGWEYGGEFAALAAKAFVAAAQRRFPPGWSTADVIRFVGRLRARNQGEQADVDAGAAEQMLLSAITGKPMRGEFSDLDKGYAQFALLAELVSDLDEGALHALLEDARDQADQWLAKATRQLPGHLSVPCKAGSRTGASGFE